MPAIWREIIGPKYIVTRRDGTVPDWCWFVLGARDKHAASTIREYAGKWMAEDPEYANSVLRLADDFEKELLEKGHPPAPRHRKDDPATIAKLEGKKGA